MIRRQFLKACATALVLGISARLPLGSEVVTIPPPSLDGLYFGDPMDDSYSGFAAVEVRDGGILRFIRHEELYRPC